MGAKLLVDGADDEVDDDGGIDGHGVAAPAGAEDAVVAAVDVEGGFETSEIADTGHDSNADGFGRNGDVFGDSVDGEIAFDVQGVLAARNDFGAAKGEGGIFFDVKEIVGAKNFVAAGSAGVEACGLDGDVDFALGGIAGAIGEGAGEILEEPFFLEDHPFGGSEGESRVGLADAVVLGVGGEWGGFGFVARGCGEGECGDQSGCYSDSNDLHRAFLLFAESLSATSRVTVLSVGKDGEAEEVLTQFRHNEARDGCVNSLRS